jgi:hypothetical protein
MGKVVDGSEGRDLEVAPVGFCQEFPESAAHEGGIRPTLQVAAVEELDGGFPDLPSA